MVYVDCEVCGERYSGSEREVRQWITETMVLDKNGEEETISHCVSCHSNTPSPIGGEGGMDVPH